jgi:hypothetical protein
LTRLISKKNIVFLVVGAAIGLALFEGGILLTRGRLFQRVSFSSGISAESSNEDFVAFAYSVLDDIRDNDFDALANIAHPEYGVVFSPYPTISLASNKCFMSAKIKQFDDDQTAYVWGVYDLDGTPIEMTPSQYFSQFVWSRNYLHASEIGVNRVIKSGNALENTSEVFPNIRFIDFHCPGEGAEGDDLTWSSLRLGFEEYRGKLYLTLILNSEWTA